MRHLAIASALGLALLALAPAGALADGRGDGAYGRLDEDLTLSFVAGGGATWPSAGDTQGSLVAEFRARFYDAAGPVVGLRWSPDSEHVFVGLELRPLWPGLFLMDMSTGHRFLDLTLQSLSVELGAAVTPLGSGRGVGFAWGLGLEMPMGPSDWLPGGFWLRFAVRRVRAPASWQAAPDGGASEWTLSSALVLRFGVGTGAPIREPTRYRLR